MERKLDLHWI